MKTTLAPRGFIALMTMILISSVLLLTTLSLTQFGLTHRFFVLDMERKTTSSHLAEACVHIARVININNRSSTMTFPQAFPIHEEFCTIQSLTVVATTSTMQTEAAYAGIHSNYTVIIDSKTGSFLSWEETINP